MKNTCVDKNKTTAVWKNTCVDLILTLPQYGRTPV